MQTGGPLLAAFALMTLATTAVGQEPLPRPAAEPQAAPEQAPGAGAGSADTRATAPVDGGQCFPACRAGYVCHQGTCVSMCNPPCRDGESCVDGTRCEPALYPGAGSVYEPPPPPVRTFAQRSHAALALHLGFGGTVEAAGVERDLSTTFGFNIRGDIPVVDYLLIGPLFQFSRWKADVAPDPGAGYALDIDLYVRGRYPIELDSVAFQIWAGIPIGVTISVLSDDLKGAGRPDELGGVSVGWNVGVLAGGAVHFTKKFGMFAEAGWLQHKMNHDRENTSGDVTFRLSQTTLNVGFVFAN